MDINDIPKGVLPAALAHAALCLELPNLDFETALTNEKAGALTMYGYLRYLDPGFNEHDYPFPTEEDINRMSKIMQAHRDEHGMLKPGL